MTRRTVRRALRASPSHVCLCERCLLFVFFLRDIYVFFVRASPQQADDLAEACPELELSVFTDRDITEDPERVSKALETADAFFASLVFDYDQVRSVLWQMYRWTESERERYVFIGKAFFSTANGIEGESRSHAVKVLQKKSNPNSAAAFSRNYVDGNIRIRTSSPFDKLGSSFVPQLFIS